MKTMLPVLATVLLLAPAAARAEEAAAASAGPATTGGFAVTLASTYVWRGQSLSEGAVLQPEVSVGIGGFTACLWGNVDLDAGEEDDDGIVLNETDVTLSYSFPAGPLALTAGLAHYDFDGSDTQELFLTAAWPVFLSPSLALSYDFDEGDGGFAELAVSHEFAAGPVSLEAGAALGINLGNGAMGLDADGEAFTGLYHAEVSLATSIPLFGNVTLDPRIAWATALGDDAEAAISSVSVDGATDVFSGSVALTASF